MKKSAGLLLYRFTVAGLEFLLIHPGGPFWKNKDLGSWSIPKGELNDHEDPLAAAVREVKEETGIVAKGDFIELQPVQQNPQKQVLAWALAQDEDVSIIKSNVFELEWPPHSGKKILVPEVDKAAWFPPAFAVEKIIPGQAPLLRELMRILENS